MFTFGRTGTLLGTYGLESVEASSVRSDRDGIATRQPITQQKVKVTYHHPYHPINTPYQVIHPNTTPPFPSSQDSYLPEPIYVFSSDPHPEKSGQIQVSVQEMESISPHLQVSTLNSDLILLSLDWSYYEILRSSLMAEDGTDHLTF